MRPVIPKIGEKKCSLDRERVSFLQRGVRVPGKESFITACLNQAEGKWSVGKKK